jgi:hypothetical protein
MPHAGVAKDRRWCRTCRALDAMTLGRSHDQAEHPCTDEMEVRRA